MRRTKILFYIFASFLLIAGLLYSNRLLILRYSLGWITDIRFPREPNHPVPWESVSDQQKSLKKDRPPNIILIMADDLGFNDVTAYGGGYADLGVPTPHIDSIAEQGVRFDSGYSGSAVCTVSRAALLTGRYPSRFGVEFTPTPGALARVGADLYDAPDRLHPVVIDKEKAEKSKSFNELGMPTSEITIAEVLKSKGYHSVHIGKWHLGSTEEMRPNKQGFNESLFMESGLYLPTSDPNVVNSKQDFDPIDKFLWPNMRYGVSYNGGKWFEPDKYLTDYFTDEAVKVVEINKDRPFFLFLAHWAVHTPLQASKEDYDSLSHIPNHRKRVYLSMIRSLDRSVGKILKAVKEKGLEENTIIIFTSDNGAPNYIGLSDVNRPYRGWKLTFFQGGIRVPYFAKWPGHIKPGTKYDHPITNIDILPTLADAAGAQLPTDREIDGVNLLPYLKGREVQKQRPLFWSDGHYQTAQFQGWKLIRTERPNKKWLFNLNSDPTEKNNLIAKHPEKQEELESLLLNYNKQMIKPLWPSFIEFPVLIDKTLDQKQEEEDEYTYWVN
ncbi:sulfatase [Leptospira kobayashii]|uniref:Sulfatase n=1 Tax=Leptospira kobayashii TaxID=1917830 RepID=A0ABM7UHF2_9LEPT|nr:sulfatase-like hydrolase/transferase [Leptospira kobayashii]BDA77967.1 sulfatase [Leptospira kobayashii]